MCNILQNNARMNGRLVPPEVINQPKMQGKPHIAAEILTKRPYPNMDTLSPNVLKPKTQKELDHIALINLNLWHACSNKL